MIKKNILILLLLISFTSYSQDKNLENYKYIIVPNRFSFFKEANQYKTSSLMKFLLKKKGFIVFLDNETFPKDLVDNGCLALKANLINKSDFFRIKSLIQLKDCHNRIIYTSKIGKTIEKRFEKAYLYSIRDAYNSMTDFKYNYKEETKPIDKDKKEVVIAKNISENVVKTVKATPITVNVEKKTNKINKEKNKINILYAQEISNGYQLINTKPKVVFQILKTNSKEIFIVKNKNGILYKSGNLWKVEYYKNDELIVEEYLIKF